MNFIKVKNCLLKILFKKIKTKQWEKVFALSVYVIIIMKIVGVNIICISFLNNKVTNSIRKNARKVRKGN